MTDFQNSFFLWNFWKLMEIAIWLKSGCAIAHPAHLLPPPLLINLSKNTLVLIKRFQIFQNLDDMTNFCQVFRTSLIFEKFHTFSAAQLAFFSGQNEPLIKDSYSDLSFTIRQQQHSRVLCLSNLACGVGPSSVQLFELDLVLFEYIYV